MNEEVEECKEVATILVQMKAAKAALPVFLKKNHNDQDQKPLPMLEYEKMFSSFTSRESSASYYDDSADENKNDNFDSCWTVSSKNTLPHHGAQESSNNDLDPTMCESFRRIGTGENGAAGSGENTNDYYNIFCISEEQRMKAIRSLQAINSESLSKIIREGLKTDRNENLPFIRKKVRRRSAINSHRKVSHFQERTMTTTRNNNRSNDASKVFIVMKNTKIGEFNVASFL